MKPGHLWLIELLLFILVLRGCNGHEISQGTIKKIGEECQMKK